MRQWWIAGVLQDDLVIKMCNRGVIKQKKNVLVHNGGIAEMVLAGDRNAEWWLLGEWIKQRIVGCGKVMYNKLNWYD